jgi:hypothetical protein
MDERRGSSGSGTALESDRGFTRHQWPTRKHTRNTSSMGSIGELASDIMNNKLKIPGQDGSKRGSIIVDTEDEDELRIREREVRALSFASSISSAMSIDEEEAGKSLLVLEEEEADDQCPCLLRGSLCSSKSKRGR